MNQLELYAQGYNLRQAARAIDRSAEHVRQVMLGHRPSARTIAALLALPKRTYKARRPQNEKLNSCEK